MRNGFWGVLTLLLHLITAAFGGATAGAAEGRVSITLMHTNDLHSHFRSEKTPLQLGGIARLRTAVLAERRKHANSLLVDGGDWSEGQIYFAEGAGAESLKLMDWVGYDAAVVGNHDWLNGPGRLLDAAGAARPKLALLGANFDVSGFDRAGEFASVIRPYLIREVQGVRVAFVGLTNFDPVYGSFLAPVRSTAPGPVAAQLARELKSQGLADIVIGVSHNSSNYNEGFLREAPAMDLIVGGHDHRKLVRPIVVKRQGHADGWIVQAGKWGQYLGIVELGFVPGKAGSLELRGYRLKQIDRSVAEDAETLARVAELEQKIEARMGPVFDDHVADCEVELSSSGLETMIGDFATDAYAGATGADIAIDQNKLIYGEIHEGVVHSVDVFNALPAIFDVAKGKAWTLHTWKMEGSTLSRLFKLMYAWRKVSASGGLAFSGLEVTYDPSRQKEELGAGDLFGGLFGGGPDAVRELRAGGLRIDSRRDYTLTASSGIVQALQAINQKYFSIAELRELKDTGIEAWKAVRDHARRISRISVDSVRHGHRVRTVQADLGVVPGSLRWRPIHTLADGSIEARIELSVRNYGGSASQETTVDLSSNANGNDWTRDASWVRRGEPLGVPSLKPDETLDVAWRSVVVPSADGLYELHARIHADDEYNTGNNSMSRFFAP